MVRYYELSANAHIYRPSEADVRGGEASALTCFYRCRAYGGRGWRGIFLIFRDQGKMESVIFRPVREGFSQKEALLSRREEFLTSPS